MTGVAASPCTPLGYATRPNYKLITKGDMTYRKVSLEEISTVPPFAAEVHYNVFYKKRQSNCWPHFSCKSF